MVEQDDIDVAEAMDLAAKLAGQGVVLAGEEIVAHHDRADAQALQGAHAGGWVLLERGHDAVESADGLWWHERDGIAHGPGDIEQRLGRLIARPSPGLPGKGRLWVDKGAGIGSMGIDKVRSLVPVGGHFFIGAQRQQALRPCWGDHRDAQQQRQCTHRLPLGRAQTPR